MELKLKQIVLFLITLIKLQSCRSSGAISNILFLQKRLSYCVILELEQKISFFAKIAKERKNKAKINSTNQPQRL